MSEPSVQSTHTSLKSALVNYIESQYFLRDRALFLERRTLLERPGEIEQAPYIEATPYYKERHDGFSDLKLKAATISFLNLAASMEGSGVFPTPFQHQAEALEAGLGQGEDVLVASGTGSGKTEAFLWSILARAEEEARERPKSWALPGFRTIVLYPMNALVSDQLGRLRRSFGQSPLRPYFNSRFSRPLTFGMYTSRTPYPGEESTEKNRHRVERIVTEYLRIERADPMQAQRLRSVGRWPAKDLFLFKTNGCVTGPEDAEMLTRQEMQRHCPDVLITNYSMLEYMLLRPIEESLFEQTASWLTSDASNVLTLVLDEAHLYRGTTGAEVGLLLRRLFQRLDIPRERVRCIFTSASLGDMATSRAAMEEFAANLVGKAPRGLRPITATPVNAASGAAFEPSAQMISELSTFELNDIYRYETTPAAFLELLTKIHGWRGAKGLPSMPSEEPRQWLGQELSSWAPVERLIGCISGQATAFSDLADKVFPGHLNGHAGLERLLALGAVALHPHGRGERPLVPVRAHLLFRGLPTLFACINPKCPHRQEKDAEKAILGKLHTAPRIQCQCGARVYELLAHRDCGTAFLRIFVEEDRKFAWHEGSRVDRKQSQEILAAVPSAGIEPLLGKERYQKAWIHIWSGSISRTSPGDQSEHFIPVWFPQKQKDEPLRWGRCPSCKRGRDQDAITTLSTKGEEPIGALIRAQFEAQPAIRRKEKLNPNEGRKLLVFSDGRQAAAKLASRLPFEAQRDAFRETLAIAMKLGGVTLLNHRLYTAFVAVASEHYLYFFSGQDQEKFLQHQEKLKKDYGSDLQAAMGSDDEPGLIEPSEVPRGFYQAMLGFLGSPFQSPFDLGLLALSPTQYTLKKLEALAGKHGLTSDDILAISGLFAEHLVRNGSVFKDLSYFEKREALGAFRIRQVDNPELPETLAELCSVNGLSEDAVSELTKGLFDELCDIPGEGDDRVFHLRHTRIRLEFPPRIPGKLCRQCGRINLHLFRGQCTRCQSKAVEELEDTDPILQARRNLVLQGVYKAIETGRPVPCLTSEEHTAQLSYKDPEESTTTVEDHELRFQGVPVKSVGGQLSPPVDVLSCTTTMEVGIDIGSLTAVAMRNVPPRRENYQQRAGRSGRRGSALSTVVTFAQGGSHDAYAFSHPTWLVSGSPAVPKTQVANRTLARRHIKGQLLQAFYRDLHVSLRSPRSAPGLSTVFGSTESFLNGPLGSFSLVEFQAWYQRLSPASRADQAKWLPFPPTESVDLLDQTFAEFCKELEGFKKSGAWTGDAGQANLLDALFEQGWMPRYAFPMDVASFYLFESTRKGVKISEKPQQSMMVALSEYAPGRVLTVDKKDYQVGGIYLPGRIDNKAVQERIGPFVGHAKVIVSCRRCTYLRYIESGAPPDEGLPCPFCGGELEHRLSLQPSGYVPKGGRSLQRSAVEEEYSRTEGAEFPIPDGPDAGSWSDLNSRIRFRSRVGQHLVAINKGPEGKGFMVCSSCGATLEKKGKADGSHRVPFLTTGSPQCTNPDFVGPFNFYYRFPTDLLSIQMKWEEPMAFSVEEPWWEAALSTLVEAIRLSASRLLDIDPDELQAGFRLSPGEDQGAPRAELYLYDSAAGGAGYAAQAGRELDQVLRGALKVLEECSCEGGCRECLEHPGNRSRHGKFNRKIASRLLHFALDEAVPDFLNQAEVDSLLTPLRRWLELEGSSDPIREKPFPAGLSKSWVGAQPEFHGWLPVSDFELINNLPAVKLMSRSI